MAAPRSRLGGERWSNMGLNLVIAILLTVLFAEWMWPLLALTETYTVYPFLLFFSAVLLVALLRLRRFLSILLLSLLLLFLLHQLYFSGPFLSLHWLAVLLQKILTSLPALIGWEWHQLAVEVRTFFFFILLWLIAISLYQNVFVRGRILFFVVMTVGYMGVLDTFTPYDARLAVLRSMVTGLALLALVQFSQLAPKASRGEVRKSKSRSWMWGIASFSFILCAVGIAYAAPKTGPTWPDPVPFIKSYATGGDMQVGKKVGYGQSDEVLGGPFMPDDTVVFEAITDRLTYWRGEAKDVYTGRGWEKSRGTEWLFPFDKFTEARPIMEASFIGPETDTEPVQATVRFVDRPLAQIFYPGDPMNIEVLTRQAVDVVGAWEQESGRLLVYRSENQRQQVGLAGYQLESMLPVYSVSALKGANLSQVPHEIMEHYTQLPDSLPERVADLAREIVEGKDTLYDQVKAIESYFRMNGYRYETEDVPVPEEGQDYVDQFLFETKRGYCDNFSTAMVVMLRTLDIPARWVKGFTGGQVIERNQGLLRVEVENNNAHSWVEVYFPEVGWVPFEPTPSFQNPFQFERDDLPSEHTSSTDQEEDPETSLEEQLPPEVQEPSFPAWDTINSGSHRKIKGMLIGAGLVLALAVMIRLLLWRRLILLWASRRYRGGDNGQRLVQAYHFLIRYLGRFVMPKHPAQTLREYMHSLESKIDVDKLEPLTQWYEETLYGKRRSSSSRLNQMYRLWLDVIRQLRKK